MDPRSMAATVRSEIWKVDPEVPVPQFRTMEQVVSQTVAQRRFQLSLVLLFAGMAVLLASLGIYGVVSHSVARRQNEMGIRVALGATPASVRRLVLRQGMAPVAAGLVAGLAAALALGRILRGFLFGVGPKIPGRLEACPPPPATFQPFARPVWT